MFMADGDPQLGNEMLGAIAMYVTNAIKVNCGWLICSQGWKRHAPNESCVPGDITQ